MDAEDMCVVIIGVIAVLVLLIIGGVGIAAIVGGREYTNDSSVTKAWCASIGDTQYASGHCFKNGIELKMGAQEDD